MDSNDIQLVLNLNAGHDIWIGYENGGFAWLNNRMPVLTMTMYMVDGDERWVEIYQSPDDLEAYYLLAYWNTDWYADSAGNHPGYHPCSAIQLTASEYEQLVAGLLGPQQRFQVSKL
jgi:hypothetical protein